MIPTWLYEQDGRALACVYVMLPQPIQVYWAGRLFAWNGSKYVAASMPMLASGPGGAANAYTANGEVPEDKRP